MLPYFDLRRSKSFHVHISMKKLGEGGRGGGRDGQTVLKPVSHLGEGFCPSLHVTINLQNHSQCAISIKVQ